MMRRGLRRKIGERRSDRGQHTSGKVPLEKTLRDRVSKRLMMMAMKA